MRDQLAKTTQVRIRPRNIVDGHAGGSIVWMTPMRARMFASMGVIDVIGDSNIKIGPQEVKGDDPGKKSFDTPISGHSTGSVSSSENGQEQPSYVSEEDPVSRPISASEFEKLVSDEAPPQSESSRSTTLTGSRRSQTSTTSQTPRGGNGTRVRMPSKPSPG